jgi:DNA-binding CsgD family transcriptional regulator
LAGRRRRPGPADFSFACAVCRCPEAFRHIVRGPVRDFVPHKGLIAVLGRGEGSEARARRMIGIDTSPSLIHETARKLDPALEKLAAKWFQGRKPFVQQPSRPSPHGRLALHGEVDLYTRAWAYFIFTGVPLEMNAGTLVHRLQLIAPLLMAPLANVDAADVSSDALLDDLDDADRQLLKWMIEGRTNPEIACLQQVNVPMVRKQAGRLYMKLGVKNRVEMMRLISPLYAEGAIGGR